MKKRIWALVLTVIIMATLLITPAVAAPVLIWTRATSTWRVKSTAFMATENSVGWNLFHTSDPAKRAGETASASTSVSYGGSISGSVQVGVEGISAAVGFSYSKSVTYTAGKTSAPLALGEYVKMYWDSSREKYKVTQEERTTGQAQYVDSATNAFIGSPFEHSAITDEAVCYPSKPITPRIRIDYFPATRSAFPSRTEIYTFEDNAWTVDMYYGQLPAELL